MSSERRLKRLKCVEMHRNASIDRSLWNWFNLFILICIFLQPDWLLVWSKLASGLTNDLPIGTNYLQACKSVVFFFLYVYIYRYISGLSKLAGTWHTSLAILNGGKSKVSQPRFVESWTPYQAWFSSVTDGNQGKAHVVATCWQHVFMRSNNTYRTAILGPT